MKKDKTSVAQKKASRNWEKKNRKKRLLAVIVV